MSEDEMGGVCSMQGIWGGVCSMQGICEKRIQNVNWKT
jgi:hypothetical protein